ncbi:hypothetical protein HDV01_004286 [Terramyces sp. JEL0728]|nr:hypothetical protein HDV01_004286 [Terramyces sp. JEL0728]
MFLSLLLNLVAAQLGTQKVFAPYVSSDTLQTFTISTFSNLTAGKELQQIVVDNGIKYIHLGFVNYWQNTKKVALGNIPLNQVGPFVSDLSAAGVTAILSFGGYTADQQKTDISMVVPKDSDVYGIYKDAIAQTGAKAVDFDLEYVYKGNEKTTDRVMNVIKQLKTDNPKLYISVTIKVVASGLSPDSMSILTAAAKAEAPIDVINIMTFDYGKENLNGKTLDQVIINSASSAYEQIYNLGFTQTSLGMTNMIGKQDEGSILSLDAAKSVLSWAKTSPYVSLLSFWALGRDQFDTTHNGLQNSTLITQKPFDFTKIFRDFDSSTTPISFGLPKADSSPAANTTSNSTVSATYQTTIASPTKTTAPNSAYALNSFGVLASLLVLLL